MALAFCLVVTPIPALAETSVRAVTALSGGASESARGVASPGQRRTASTFGRSQLQLDLDVLGKSTQHQLTYLVGLTGYADERGFEGVNQEAWWLTSYTGGRSWFQLGATGGHGVVDDITSVAELRAPPEAFDQQTGELLPNPALDEAGLQQAGILGYAGGAVTEGFGFTLTPRLSAYQAAEVQLYSTLVGSHAEPPVLAVAQSYGLEYSWPRDSARIDVDLGYENAPELTFGEEVFPQQESQFGRAALGWGHELAPGWGMDLAGGAYGVRADTHQNFIFGPAWRGSLRWRGRLFRATGTYDRSVYPSIALGGVFRSDRVTLRSNGSFGRDGRFQFRSRFRFQRLGAFGAPEGAQGPVDRWQARVGLAGRFWNRRDMELELAYRLTHQDPGLLGEKRLRALERNIVMLTFTFGLQLAGAPPLEE